MFHSEDELALLASYPSLQGLLDSNLLNSKSVTFEPSSAMVTSSQKASG